ncbi:MAG: HK97 family phage prohead protease [Planctomycetota bacterium]
MDTENPTQLELRFHPTEVRMAQADEGKESRTLEGVLVPYNTPSDLRYFTEKFQPGCFTESLDDSTNKRGLFEHDHKQLLCSTRNGTFRLIDTPEALRFEMDVCRASHGDNALILVKDGEIRGASIGMIVHGGSELWEYDEETDHATRTIVKAKIVEGSITSIPQYEETEVSARFAAEHGEEAIQAKVAELRAKHKGTPELDKRWMVYRHQIADAA